MHLRYAEIEYDKTVSFKQLVFTKDKVENAYALTFCFEYTCLAKEIFPYGPVIGKIHFSDFSNYLKKTKTKNQLLKNVFCDH